MKKLKFIHKLYLGIGFFLFIFMMGSVIINTYYFKNSIKKHYDDELINLTESLYHISHNSYTINQSWVNSNLNVSNFYVENKTSLDNIKVPLEIEDQITHEKTIKDIPLMLVDNNIGINKVVTNNNQLVDFITNQIGGTVTIFQLIDEGLLRISTSVKRKDGSRAIGTYINKKSPVYQSIINGNTYRGRAFVVNDWYITAYKPILKNENIIGAIYVGIKQTELAKLNQTIQQFRLNNEFHPLIFDIQGNAIINPLNAEKNILNIQDGENKKFILEIRNQILNEGNTEGNIEYKWISNNNRILKRKLHYKYLPELEWVITTSMNKEAITKPLTEQTGINIFVSILLFVIVLILVLITSSRFTKQLNILRNTVSEYTSNKLDSRAEIVSHDELGELAVSFNLMADKLNGLYKNLHEKVDERTQELNEKTEELQQQNEEIEQQNEEIRAINDEIQQMNADLAESEMKVRQMIENLEDEYIFYSQHINGKYAYVSSSITKILGYSEKDVEYGIKGFLTDHKKNTLAAELSDKARKGEKQPPFEIELFDKNKNIKHFELLEVPVFDKQGEVTLIEGLLHDITERKKAERVQRVLNYITHSVATTDSLRELVLRIQKELGRIIDTTNFYIAFYNDTDDTISLPFMADENDQIESFPAGKTMTNYVIKNQKSLLATETKQEELVEQGHIEFVGTRSKVWLGVPLINDGKAIGAIAVQSYSNTKAYNENDKELLEFISSQISLAIERKRSSEKIKEEKDYAERILTVVPSSVFTVDKNEIITSWNKKAETVTGWTAKETIGQKCDKFALTPCQQNCGLYDDSIPKPITNRECTIKTKDGRTLTIMKNVDYLRDTDGNIIGGIESFEDITERKRQELIQKIISNISNSVSTNENLEDLIAFIQDQLSKLIDTTNYFIALYDANSDTLSLPFIADEKDRVSDIPAKGTLTGYVIKTKKPLIINEEGMGKLEEKGEIELVGSSSKIWLGVPLIAQNNVIGAMVVQSYENEKAFGNPDLEFLEIVSHQVSRSIERKRNAEELKVKNFELNTQKEELETTLENLKETQTQLIQTEKMAALGTLIAGIAHEINTPLGAINASVGNMADSLETAIQNLPVLVKTLLDKDLSLFIKVLKFVDDSSPELTSKEKRQLKRQITSTLSEASIENPDKIAEMIIYMRLNKHLDSILPMLKTPNAHFILSNARNIVSLKKNTQNITIAVSKAAKVVFALKKFAHRDHVEEKTPADIVDGLETVITLYHNQIKQGVEIIREIEPLPPVLCFADEINQVWTNLFHNSLQAMENKGTITVKTWVENNFANISITDTGGGIPEEIRDKIFEPFFTTKKAGEGSGLGLDIVKKIIDKHNGEIKLDTETGVGTTFTISLPIES